VVYEKKEPETVQKAEGEKEKVKESGEEENYQQTTDKATTAAAEKPAVKEVKKSTPVKYKYYTVQKGDTLSKIANSKGVTVNQIKNLNKGLKENKLTVGQKIRIKQI